MAKAKIIPINKKGGEKIDFKTADSGIKKYWDLVNKDQVKRSHFPKSWSFDLHKVKAYLDEVESEFARLNIPYGERKIALLPAFLADKETFSVIITPSITDADGRHQYQFNQPKGRSKKLAAAATTDWTLDALNFGDINPPPPIQ